MNRRLLRTKKSEITKAGRLVFDAIFGDGHEIEREIEREEQLDRERGSITVAGEAFVQCDCCGKRQPLPPAVDAAVAKHFGWRERGDGSWRCPACAAAGR
jgi:hypothetical protein